LFPTCQLGILHHPAGRYSIFSCPNLWAYGRFLTVDELSAQGRFNLCWPGDLCAVCNYGHTKPNPDQHLNQNAGAFGDEFGYIRTNSNAYTNANYAGINKYTNRYFNPTANANRNFNAYTDRDLHPNFQCYTCAYPNFYPNTNANCDKHPVIYDEQIYK